MAAPQWSLRFLFYLTFIVATGLAFGRAAVVTHEETFALLANACIGAAIGAIAGFLRSRSHYRMLIESAVGAIAILILIFSL